MPRRVPHERSAATNRTRRGSTRLPPSGAPRFYSGAVVNKRWCEASLRDPNHLFARMWGKSAWVRFDPIHKPACWEPDGSCGTGGADDVCAKSNGGACAARSILPDGRYCYQLSAAECSQYVVRVDSRLHACQTAAASTDTGLHACKSAAASTPSWFRSSTLLSSWETLAAVIQGDSPPKPEKCAPKKCMRGPACSGPTGAVDFWEAMQTDRGRRRLCRANWYEGAEYLFGGRPPRFPAAAPPLFGFDNEMDRFCVNNGGHAGGEHYVQHCVAAGFNQLSLLSGGREPYNICRNIEYQVCAANGLIKDQPADGSMVFASRPGSLDPGPDSMRNLGWCGGPMPPQYRSEHCSQHWGNDDIFFLEMCVFHMVCRNAGELLAMRSPGQPQVAVGQPWRCDFSEELFEAMRQTMLNVTSLLRGYP